jgi:hypothetical protein
MPAAPPAGTFWAERRRALLAIGRECGGVPPQATPSSRIGPLATTAF